MLGRIGSAAFIYNHKGIINLESIDVDNRWKYYMRNRGITVNSNDIYINHMLATSRILWNTKYWHSIPDIMVNNNNNTCNECIYFMSSSPYIKIGRTNNLKKRIIDLQTGSPVRMFVPIHIKINDNVTIERILQNKLKHKHLYNEWFDVSLETIIEIVQDLSLYI